MVALGLLLSLVFGAVVCGGLGSIARQKNVEVHYDVVSDSVHKAGPLC